MNTKFDSRLKKKLSTLNDLGLHRELPDVSQGNQRKIKYEGNEYINFSSNDYLGLSTSQEVVEKAQEVMEQYGIGSAGSRLICGNHPLYTRLEDQLTTWKNREASLVFGSGFLTSTGIIRALMSSRDKILYDELSHRCLLEGIQLSQANAEEFSHNDMKELEQCLDESVDEHDAILIVTEGIFSMDGDRSPLPKVYSLAEDFEAWVMVDEAHSAGIWGCEGSGLTPELDGKVEVAMGTLSKAIGGYGGYVCGSENLKQFLVNRATTLIYSTGLPASVIAGDWAALKILRNESKIRSNLKENISIVSEHLDDHSIPHPEPLSQIVPLLTGSIENTLKAADLLQDNGIFAVPIRYPTVPRKKGRVRISLRADHTKDDINTLKEGIKTVSQADLLSRENIWR